MQIKTCVHALLHSKKVYHINLMDTNLSLFHHSFIGGTLPEVNDYATSTNFLTLAGQLVNIINNANINNIPQLTLASGEIKGDCVGCLQNYATANFDNPSVSNLAPQYEWIISFYVTADYNVSGGGGGGGGSPIDYTNVLTNINSNLVLLKDSFKNVFEFPTGESVIRGTETYGSGLNFVTQFIRFYRLFCVGSPSTSTTGVPDSNKLLFLIQDKLSETVSNVDVPLLKEIALAVSSLASASDNQAIKTLKDTISALELKVENNNVLLVDGQQDFCIKDYRELEPNRD